MKQSTEPLTKQYFWKRNDGRYYKIIEHPTLFGTISLVCCWGNINTKLGNFKIIHCKDEHEFEKTLQTIYKTRKAHGYLPSI